MTKVDNRNPNLQTQFQQQKVGAQKSAQISGSKAAANLAGMLANVESPNIGAPKAGPSSLLGPVASEQKASGSSPLATGHQSFSLESLGVGAAVSHFTASEALRDAKFQPHGPAWRSEVGQALDKALSRLQGQVLARAQSLATAANQAIANNPQLQKAIAEVNAAATKSQNGVKSGAEQTSNLNGQDGQVFGGFVSLAAQAGGAQGIDLTKMPIEDAMVYMMMLCSKDARGDLEDILSQMQATNKKRAAYREAETLMKEQQAKIESDLRAQYDNLPNKSEISFEDFEKTQPVTIPKVKLDLVNGKASLAGADDTGTTTDEVVYMGDHVGKMSDFTTALDSISNQKDSLSDMTQEQQLKMQMAMERMTKMDQMASNISKKINDTVMAFVANFK